jgi:hypothetical protein
MSCHANATSSENKYTVFCRDESARAARPYRTGVSAYTFRIAVLERRTHIFGDLRDLGSLLVW